MGDSSSQGLFPALPLISTAFLRKRKVKSEKSMPANEVCEVCTDIIPDICSCCNMQRDNTVFSQKDKARLIRRFFMTNKREQPPVCSMHIGGCLRVDPLLSEQERES